MTGPARDLGHLVQQLDDKEKDFYNLGPEDKSLIGLIDYDPESPASNPPLNPILARATRNPGRQTMARLARDYVAASSSPTKSEVGLRRLGRANRDWTGVAVGLTVAAVAGAISYATYSAADGGGAYVVLWGAVLWGLWKAGRSALR